MHETRPPQALLDGDWVWLPAVVPNTELSMIAGARPIESRRRFLMVDADGRYVGLTEWPDEPVVSSGAQIVDGRLLAMVWDEDIGEILPTVYRILPAVDGLVYA